MPELKYTSNYCCDICADGYHYFTYGDWETSWLDWEMIDELKEELEEFIYSLTKEQFDKLEKFFVTSPKIVQTIECDCPKCGKHNVSKLEGLQNFFV